MIEEWALRRYTSPGYSCGSILVRDIVGEDDMRFGYNPVNVCLN